MSHSHLSISQATLQEVQQAVRIEEVVADFVSLKKKGKNLWACCPFHQEKTPSFSVTPDKGFYKCFGCDAAGDAITFVQEIEGVSFAEAIRYLANKYGIEIQESAPNEEQLQRQHEKDSLYILLELAKEYYVRTLWEHREGQTVGLGYFRERGFSDTFIKQFELGYSLDTWEEFYRFAREQGYEKTLLEKAGLVISKENRCYDRFRGRVLFPIHNVSGKVVAFGARILRNDKNQPKYINSPETAVYHKGSALYGIFQAKQQIKQEDNCYLVEGYTDVLALHMAGVANVVASSGTALTEEQVQLIGRFTQNITILFDGDAAGTKASLRGVDIVLEKGLNVRVVSLPEGEDPDSYARKLGSSGFRDYIKQEAQDFIQFKAALLVREAQEDPIQKAQAIKEVIESIILIPDAVQRAVLTQQCSKLLGIEEAVLIAEQHQLRAQRERQQARRATQTSKAPMAVMPKEVPLVAHRLEEGIEAYERESIRLLLSYGNILLEDGQPLYAYLFKELKEVQFQTPTYRTILDHFQQQLAKGEVVDTTYFIQQGDEALKKAVIDLAASPHDISAQWEEKHHIYTAREDDDLHQTAFKNVLRLKLRLIQQLIEENRASLKNSPGLEEEDRLLQVHAALKTSEASIAQQLGIVVW